jgi:sugar phosphate isomerase/epimerase
MLKIGVCTPWDTIDQYVNTGVDYIEIGLSQSYDAETGKMHLAEHVKHTTLPVLATNLFLPSSIKVFAMPEKVVSYAKEAIAQAAEVGIETMVFGSGGSRAKPDDMTMEETEAQFIEIIKEIAPFFEEANIYMALEPLIDANFINTLEDGLRIVSAVNSSHVGMVADTYHLPQEEFENLERFRPYVVHGHLGEPVSRVAPESEYLCEVLRALDADPNTTKASLECKWEDKVAEVAEAVEFCRECLK